MTEPLRRAGRGILADGSTLLWSVAEGASGRRWRSATLDPAGTVVLVLLLDVDPVGRIGRLELTSATGMLTFHPEPDGRSAHGNVVNANGVRPIALAWSEDHELRVMGSPIPAAVAARHRPTSRTTAQIVAVNADLDVEELADVPPAEGNVAVDERGIPLLAGASEWALETP